MGLKERIQADMQKAAKERNSLALSALRMALAAIKNKETEEIDVLEEYLPKPLTDAEVESLVREAIAAAGAKSPADMGRVMKELMPKVAGRADGKTVNEIVRRLLAG